MHVEKVTGGNVTMKLMSVEEVAALRQLDDVYKNQMQNLETGMVSQGLNIAANLSTMLMKRKNHESNTTQRKVSRLVDMSATINIIAARRIRVEDSQSIHGILQDDDEGAELLDEESKCAESLVHEKP